MSNKKELERRKPSKLTNSAKVDGVLANGELACFREIWAFSLAQDLYDEFSDEHRTKEEVREENISCLCC